MAVYQGWETRQEILGSRSQAVSSVMEAITLRVATCTVIQQDTAGFIALPATTALMPGGRRNCGGTTCSP